MPFVNVRLVTPDSKRYRVEIDPDLDVEIVKSQLLQKLQIKTGKKYTLLLVDSFSLAAGDELRLVEMEEQAVGELVPDE
jgi:hypothetical protein